MSCVVATIARSGAADGSARRVSTALFAKATTVLGCQFSDERRDRGVGAGLIARGPAVPSARRARRHQDSMGEKDQRFARIHAAPFQRISRGLPVIGRSDADCSMPRGGAYASDGWRFLFSYRGPAARISFALAPLSAGSPSVRRRSSGDADGTGPVQKGDRCLEPVRP